MPDVDQNSHYEFLIQQAIEGDKEAFGRLYESTASQIFDYLYIRLGDSQQSEDMTEVVFLRAWDNMPELRKKRTGFSFAHGFTASLTIC